MPDPAPAVVVVPVRRSVAGSCSLWVCRRAAGGRVGVAFTSEHLLDAALGADQARVHLHVTALRSMLVGVGVQDIQVDPDMVAFGAPRARAS